MTYLKTNRFVLLKAPLFFAGIYFPSESGVILLWKYSSGFTKE